MVTLGIVIAAAVACVFSAVYYGAVEADTTTDSAPRRPAAALLLVELLRNLAVASLVAGVLAAANWNGWGSGALLGLSLWTLPAVLLAGSVFHEGVPTRRAAVHAVDWLVKLVAIGAILGLFT